VTQSARCTICGGGANPFGRAVVLGKYDVQYFRCTRCGLVTTEFPYWLSEAYRDAIAEIDIGVLRRNLRAARAIQVFIRMFSEPAGRFVDYGGGYGVLTRLMRDAGYDFFRFDTHCINLFAAGFDIVRDDEEFTLLTAIEVFEHFVDPVSEMERISRLGRTVLFTTELVPEDNPPLPGAWWYYGLSSGQHVTLYTRRSLELLAGKFGLRYYSAAGLHVFSDRNFSPLLFTFAMKAAFRLPVPFCGRRQPLLEADFEKVTGYALR